MKNWNDIWKEITTDNNIIEEYKVAVLLNMFQKLCHKMNTDFDFRQKVLNLYRQSFDKNDTTSLIFKDLFEFALSTEDAIIITKWVTAYFKKSNSRKTISLKIKKELYAKQNGICSICGEKLGSDWSKIHVDHIIPWSLVGDELENNYQDLCESCNECKSSKTDYIFRSLIHLN